MYQPEFRSCPSRQPRSAGSARGLASNATRGNGGVRFFYLPSCTESEYIVSDLDRRGSREALEERAAWPAGQLCPLREKES